MRDKTLFFCPYCAGKLDDGATFCAFCGAKLDEEASESIVDQLPSIERPSVKPDSGRLCPICGGRLNTDSVFCDFCGARVDGAVSSQEKAAPDHGWEEEADHRQARGPEGSSAGIRPSSAALSFGDAAAKPRTPPPENKKSPDTPAVGHKADGSARITLEQNAATQPEPNKEESSAAFAKRETKMSEIRSDERAKKAVACIPNVMQDKVGDRYQASAAEPAVSLGSGEVRSKKLSLPAILAACGMLLAVVLILYFTDSFPLPGKASTPGTAAVQGSAPRDNGADDISAVYLPELVNSTYADAIDQLNKLGLCHEDSFALSENVGEGRVISMTPPAGAEMRAGDTVFLEISTGYSNAQGQGSLVHATDEPSTPIPSQARDALSFSPSGGSYYAEIDSWIPGWSGVYVGGFLQPESARASASWHSSNSAVAVVDESGWVSLLKEGSTVITASTGEESASYQLDVVFGFTQLAYQLSLGSSPPSSYENTSRFHRAIPDSVLASSEIAASSNGSRFTAEMVVDGDVNTSWQEDSYGSGIGEWIRLDYDSPVSVSAITIWPGYWKRSDLFTGNGRPRSLLIAFSEDECVLFDLEDSMLCETVILSQPLKASSICIRVLDVWRGATWNDMAISEIAVFEQN